MPPEAVPQMVAGADAGLVLIEPICLSYRLTLPNKLFEYLSVGLPVIASDLPAIAAVVRDTGAGVIVDPADRHAVARAFAEVTDPVRGAELRRHAELARDSLDPERELDALADVYRSVTW